TASRHNANGQGVFRPYASRTLYATAGTPVTSSNRVIFARSSAADETEARNKMADACRDPQSTASSAGFACPLAGSKSMARKWTNTRNQATLQNRDRAERTCRSSSAKIPASTATVTRVGIFSNQLI